MTAPRPGRGDGTMPARYGTSHHIPPTGGCTAEPWVRRATASPRSCSSRDGVVEHLVARLQALAGGPALAWWSSPGRLMVRWMTYLRLERLPVGAAYERFLGDHLAPGGTVLVLWDRSSWPVTHVAEAEGVPVRRTRRRHRRGVPLRQAPGPRVPPPARGGPGPVGPPRLWTLRPPRRSGAGSEAGRRRPPLGRSSRASGPRTRPGRAPTSADSPPTFRPSPVTAPRCGGTGRTGRCRASTCPCLCSTT